MNPKSIRFVNEIETFMRSLKFSKVKITFNTLKTPIEWKQEFSHEMKNLEQWKL